MAKRGIDERVNQAFELFKQGKKLVEIASQLNMPEGTVRSWKSRYKWDEDNNATLQKDKRNVAKKKKGGQPGNKNATGPPGNKHAEKHGFLTKYLPPETADIINNTLAMDPIDILWQNISIQYAAIIRAQKIMHVTNKKEMIKEVKRLKEKSTESSTAKKTSSSSETEIAWEFQFAWDRHATFLNAQSRAMAQLTNMIKKYDDMLHANWDTVTEEQKLRVEKVRTHIEEYKIKKEHTEKKIELEKERFEHQKNIDSKKYW